MHDDDEDEDLDHEDRESNEPVEGDWTTEDHVTFWENGGLHRRPVLTLHWRDHSFLGGCSHGE